MLEGKEGGVTIEQVAQAGSREGDSSTSLEQSSCLEYLFLVK